MSIFITINQYSLYSGDPHEIFYSCGGTLWFCITAYVPYFFYLFFPLFGNQVVSRANIFDNLNEFDKLKYIGKNVNNNF